MALATLDEFLALIGKLLAINEKTGKELDLQNSD